MKERPRAGEEGFPFPPFDFYIPAELPDNRRRLAYALVAVRHLREIPEKTAASKFGITVAALRKMEDGYAAPTVFQMADIIRLYDVPLGFFLDPPEVPDFSEHARLINGNLSKAPKMDAIGTEPVEALFEPLPDYSQVSTLPQPASVTESPEFSQAFEEASDLPFEVGVDEDDMSLWEFYKENLTEAQIIGTKLLTPSELNLLANYFDRRLGNFKNLHKLMDRFSIAIARLA